MVDIIKQINKQSSIMVRTKERLTNQRKELNDSSSKMAKDEDYDKKTDAVSLPNTQQTPTLTQTPLETVQTDRAIATISISIMCDCTHTHKMYLRNYRQSGKT